MKKNYSSIILVLCFLWSLGAKAQSATSYSSLYVGVGGTADMSDTLYLGPGLFELDGNWEIYSEYILIDPNATFTGPGTLMIMNPGLWTGTSVSTKLDANNNIAAIDVNVNLQNDATVVLRNLNFPADFISTFGWSENTSSTLYAGKDLNFGIDGAHLVLDNVAVGDLRLDADATVSGYRPERHVVTNTSILSHMVKEAYSAAFTFPVGIAAGDYTPAQVSNASANTIHVSVQDYASSASPEALLDGTVDLADGMNRTWHIFADNASIASTVNLQHNLATNQSGFSNASHFVTQWGSVVPNTSGDNSFAFSSSPWQSNFPGAGSTGTLLTGSATLPTSTMKSRTYASLATSPLSETSYFTKSSDPFHPLPLKVLSFTTTAADCDVLLKWRMSNNASLSKCHLFHSFDGSTFNLLATLNSSTQNGEFSYQHESAGRGKHYYRLKVVEENGEVTEAPVQTASLSCDFIPAVVKVYPNPATDFLTIEGLEDKVEYTLRLLSIDAKPMIELKSKGPKTSIDISQLPQGTYMLQLLDQYELKFSAPITKL